MSLLAALAPLLHLVATAHVPAPQDCFERSAAIERPHVVDWVLLPS
jgi:hypothetical protein